MAVDLVLPLATLLKQCLCDAVAAAANPPQNCCLRLQGDIWQDMDSFTDLCCEGLAYVAVGDMWVSSNSFPTQDIVRQADAVCSIPSWGVDLKMGIFRCSPLASNDMGAIPTCEQYTAAAVQQMADAQSLRIAACCFRNNYQNLDPQMVGMSVVINRLLAYSPQGGCIERALTIQVQFPAACDGC